jgi:hypothetical protein
VRRARVDGPSDAEQIDRSGAHETGADLEVAGATLREIGEKRREV